MTHGFPNTILSARLFQRPMTQFPALALLWPGALAWTRVWNQAQDVLLTNYLDIPVSQETCFHSLFSWLINHSTSWMRIMWIFVSELRTTTPALCLGPAAGQPSVSASKYAPFAPEVPTLLPELTLSQRNVSLPHIWALGARILPFESTTVH